LHPRCFRPDFQGLFIGSAPFPRPPHGRRVGLARPRMSAK
jgi:hypothetical protein